MKKINAENIDKVKEKLLSAGKVVIVSHENPDGDTIGSATAFYGVLSRLGVDIYLVVNDTMPEFLQWMPFADKYLVYENSAEEVKRLLEEAGMVVHIDYNSYGRTGKMKDLLKGYKGAAIMIDHHPNPDDIAEFAFSFPGYSSTAEIMYNFLELAGWQGKVDKEVATCLYVGIITDTGNFSFNSSSPQLFETVAKLLRTGIDKDDIYRKVFYNFSYDRMRLVGFALSERMVYWKELSTAFIYLYKEDLKRFNHKKGDTENLVNMIFYIKGVKLALLMVEKEGFIKMSIRSQGDFPANYLAQKYFNGGGHLNAAGAKCYKNMDGTIEKLKKVLTTDEEIKKHI